MTLTILLDPADPDRAALWYDDRSGDSGTATPLSSLGARAGDSEVCVALPGEAAVSRVFDLKMKRRRDIERAATLMIEDQLAAPIPQQRMAFSPVMGEGRVAAAYPGAAIAEWLERLQAHDLDPETLTVDHALLPAPEDGHVELLVGDRKAVRLVDGAFTAETAFVETLGEGPVAVVTAADLLPPDRVPNFRTGSFAKRRPLPDLKPFALAAGLLVAAGVLFLAGSLLEAARYASAADRLEEQAEAAFVAANPQTPVFDLERQLQSGGRRGVQSQFLPLTSVLADVLADHDSASLSSLSYDRDGQLTAEVTFSSFSELEVVTSELRDRGVIAEEGDDARREDGAFVTRLFLRSA